MRKRSALAALALRPAVLARFVTGERRAFQDRSGRLVPALLRLPSLRDRLAALDRMRLTLGHAETLRRGFAVVRAGGRVVTTAGAARAQAALEIEFQDGRHRRCAGRVGCCKTCAGRAAKNGQGQAN